MSIKINSIQGISAMSANGTNRYKRTNPLITNRNPLWNFHKFQGTVAGYASGGEPLFNNRIEKFPFATDSNSTDVSDLSVNKGYHAGQSSELRGYTSGGSTAASLSNVIDKFPFATSDNATDVGDLTVARRDVVGQSGGDVSGYTSGGTTSPPTARSNVIDKFPFAADANATDVGDLTLARAQSAGHSSTVSGYTSGGWRAPTPPSIPNNYTNVIDKFPFASNANATDVGDLTGTNSLRVACTGQSSSVSGYTSGGYNRRDPQVPAPLSPIAGTTIIQKFPFAIDLNATDVGNLSIFRAFSAGQSSTVSGYTSGGVSVSTVIDKFPFATNANATDVGDLTAYMTNVAGQQD